MSVAVRFAPSPTGLLHLGNARTALITWLFARAEGGSFLLRIDDTDAGRSEERFVDAIKADLSWLGIDWDREARQSDRAGDYAAAIARLKADGRLYPCYETAEELALKRTAQLQAGKPPVYDRAALALSEADRAELEAAGRRPHWRFKLEHAPIEWHDRVRGPVRFNGADLSDPVLIREDGSPLYHLCSVLDDIDFAITDVVRGEDHVANTAAHVQMFQALGADPPGFAHLPLIADAGGQGLSKRLGSLSLQSLREEEGLEPMAVASLLARLGTSDPIEPVADMGRLIVGFDWAKFARATPKLDPAELDRLNAKLVHDLPFEAARGRLAALGISDPDPAFWAAVRPNLTRLADAAQWHAIARQEIEPAASDEDTDYLAQAAAILPEEPWDEATWKAWIEAVKQATGRKGKGLFLPLRRALTGLDHGPELAALLPLIGRDRALARLRGERA
jgi:glutamyl-tRNA synthetase